MTKPEAQPKLELKAVILAGGKETAQGGPPMVLQRLGERTILDYVLANARQVVAADDLYVVVGDWPEAAPAKLGTEASQLIQPKPLGTGHAVLELAPSLKDY